MRVTGKISELRRLVCGFREKREKVGLVPTMGYLHEGHLSLIRAAGKECDKVVVSIFVNPVQFGPGEDLEEYPRDPGRDVKLAERGNADVVFVPEVPEMYPLGFNTFVEVQGPPAEGLCAAARSGHFRGVATVVCKLFNIVGPDAAYFGQKDAQQAAVVKRVVRDLDVPVDIRVMPTVREDDGLAMSSRNVYLSPDERSRAVSIHRALLRAAELVSSGVKDAGCLVSAIEEALRDNRITSIDYVCVVDPDTMEPVGSVEGEALIVLAARVGKTRLIDNILVTGHGETRNFSGEVIGKGKG